jgi:hypothetical protein
MATTSQQTSVNLGDTQIFNLKVVETLPPNSPFGKLLNTPQVQTTPQLARGYMPGSSIDLLNNNLAHVCDFKFIFNVNFDLFGSINPVAALQKAIKNAKLKATNRLRSLLQDAINGFRTVVSAVLKALGYDPSGQVSFYWSTAKDVIRKINETIEFIAEKAEIVLEWIFFAKQIQELITWIGSLPAKLKAMLQDCLRSFSSSLNQIASNVKSIPDQITNLTTAQAQSIANEFTSAANLTLQTLQSTDTGVPAAISAALNDPNASHVDVINQYILDTVPSANSISANTTSSMMANTSSP